MRIAGADHVGIIGIGVGDVPCGIGQQRPRLVALPVGPDQRHARGGGGFGAARKLDMGDGGQEAQDQDQDQKDQPFQKAENDPHRRGPITGAAPPGAGCGSGDRTFSVQGMSSQPQVKMPRSRNPDPAKQPRSPSGT